MFIDIIQLSSAILLIITILLQSRGTGLGSAFGGGDSVQQTKRGAEKGLYYLTIILSIIFLGTALINVIF
jgi:protein translocase SecG subunit|tara:strand:+ start:687 stop:896 length:210 start_codon:yes stop_codon:yes gene_type:complete